MTMKLRMMNRHKALRKTLTFACCALMLSSLVAAPAQPLNIGTNPQLFVDDYLIERLDGLKREVQQPQRHGPPVLDSKTFGVTQPYLTVLRDAATGKWRMFYNHGPAIWHADSEDGIAWKNPRVAFDCPRGYGCSVVDDGARD